MKDTIKKHIINARGCRLNKRLIVFESDDWGAIRIPNNKIREELLKNGLLKPNDPFSRYDTLETGEDYEALFNVLKKHKDKNGQNPIITANFILNNPSFEKIKNENFQSYFAEPFTSTYKKVKASENAFHVLQQGINQNIIAPQFHGSEHLNVVRWMNYLKSGDKRFLVAFKNDCFAIDESSIQNRRHNLMATYDCDSEEEFAFTKKNIQSGLNQFEDIFGFKSLTSIAPCYVWDNRVEQEMFDSKVTAFQGSFLQNYPIAGKPFKKIYHYNGQKNNLEQLYFIRNGLFEPSINSKIDWVSKCLESIEIAFKWGKPAIVGTHRINFVGQMDKKRRNQNLEMFDQLLLKITQKWADIQFESSDNLLKYY